MLQCALICTVIVQSESGVAAFVLKVVMSITQLMTFRRQTGTNREIEKIYKRKRVLTVGKYLACYCQFCTEAFSPIL